MGVVWLAERRDDGARFAIKTITPRMRRDHRVRQRFLREATAVFRLRHPHIVRLVDFHESPVDGAMAMVMEYVDGPSLAVHRATPLPWSVLRPLLLQVADALAFAHGLGVVHRDLKPENVLIGEDPLGAPMAKLVDFGIVHLAEVDQVLDGARITGATRLGTPPYVAPEMLLSPDVAHPGGDIHAFGVMVQELISGELPWEARTAADLLHAKLTRAPQPLRVRPGSAAPPEVAKVVGRCLGEAPLHRYWFMADVRRAIESLPDRGAVPEAEGEPGGRLRVGYGAGLLGPAVEMDTEEFSVGERARRGDDLPGLLAGALRVGPGARAFVREPAFVGREEERRRLRGVVSDVIGQRRGRAITLCGVSGVGKSRLLHWLRGVLVYEGLMLPMVVDVGTQAPDEAMRLALLRVLGTSPAPSAPEHERLARTLTYLSIDDPPMRALATSVLVEPGGGMRAGEPSPAGERWRGYGHLLHQMASRRPLCVIFEGVSEARAREMVRLVAWFMEALELADVPLLAVVSVTVEAALGRQGATDAARRVGAELERGLQQVPTTTRDRFEVLALSPLDSETLGRMLSSVGAHPTSVAEHADHAGGIPAAAIELQWTFGEATPGQSPAWTRGELLAEALRTRLALVAWGSLSVERLQSLLMLLSIGPPTMDLCEIEAVVRRIGDVVSPEQLVQALRALVGERLLFECRWTPAAIAFRGRLWRPLLRRLALRDPRIVVWSQAWDEAIQSSSIDGERLVERAHYRLRLDEPEGAAVMLFDAAATLLEQGDIAAMEHQVETAERLLFRLGERPGHQWLRLRGRMLRCAGALAEGDTERASRGLEARPEGPPGHALWWQLSQARIDDARGDSATARRTLRDVIALARARELREPQAEALATLGSIEGEFGRIGVAATCLQEAVELFHGRELFAPLACARLALAEVLAAGGMVEEAEDQVVAAERWVLATQRRGLYPRVQWAWAQLSEAVGAPERALAFLRGARGEMQLRTDVLQAARIELALAERWLLGRGRRRALRMLEGMAPVLSGRPDHRLARTHRAMLLTAQLVNAPHPALWTRGHELLDAARDTTLSPATARALQTLARVLDNGDVG